MSEAQLCETGLETTGKREEGEGEEMMGKKIEKEQTYDKKLNKIFFIVFVFI
jgi:hypothetical protein